MPAQVRFILGRAGSGKTHFVRGELAACMKEGRRAALLVPEQFTFETERALSEQLGGLLGIQVLSFERLAERVAAADAREHLSAQGRRMVVRRAVHQKRGELVAFPSVARRPGFAARMDELMTDCRRYLITPEMLEAAAEGLPTRDPLKSKLLDIATLYRATQEYLEARYLDGEDALSELIARMPHSFLRDAELYIDGFEQLTGQHYAILRQMFLVCGKVTITLCLDEDAHARDASLFAPERRAYLRLREEAYSLGCSVGTIALPPSPPPGKDPALYRLERELYAYPPRVYEGGAEAITLMGAVDRAAEVEAVADAVLKAAREGLRFRDMAVIASDMPAYADAVGRAFARRGIPVFMDARRGMQGHPPVELLLAACRAVSGLPRAELLRIAKTGLAGVADADAEAFENYCLRRGFLGGSVMETPFPAEEEAAERARAKLVPPLIALREGFKKKTAGEKTRALYEYLAALDVEKQLTDQVKDLNEKGRFALMEEHAQVWEVLMELFSQLYAILGGEEMGRQEYIEVLTEALSAYQVGVIPATADQVLFGDINRTRSREVRALFLLGCNEGMLPAPRMDEQIIDDAELETLSGLGVAPWGGTARRAEADRLSIYRALSRAGERLWLGFAYSDGSREQVPAALIARVRALFPGCAAPSAGEAALPESPQSGFLLLLRGLGRNTPLTEALRAYYAGREEYAPRLRQAEAFAREPAVPLSFGAPAARRLYGERLTSSVSALETFRMCPFRHFAQYGLRARPRREFKEKKLDIGSFSHMALERFVREMALRGDWESVTREDSDALLDTILPECLAKYENGMLVGSPRARALSTFYMDAVRETAWALCQSFAKGDFRPIGFELRFGAGEALPPLTIPLPRGGEAVLSGAIDRLDEAAAGNRRLLRVVDYKTGDHAFPYPEIADGLKLQLPVYLAAVSSDASPAGMYYQPVVDPVVQEGEEDGAGKQLLLVGATLSDEDVLRATEGGLSGTSGVVSGIRRKKDGALRDSPGLLTAEQMKLLLTFAVKRAGEIAAELLTGSCAARPVKRGMGTVCSSCEYRAVCRFDTRLPGCRVRTVRPYRKDAFFEELQKKI